MEPEDVPEWGAEMYGYSGLHYLRRIAAHLDAGKPLPPPGTGTDDPVLHRYGQQPGFLARLLRRGGAYQGGFDHLMLHSDCEGYYLPQDFADVVVLENEWVGSAPRLLRELDRLATVLEIPEDLDPDSEALWFAGDTQGKGDTRWERYGVESFSCVRLREGCRRSIATGAALIFT